MLKCLSNLKKTNNYSDMPRLQNESTGTGCIFI